MALFLLASVPVAVPTPLDRRRQAVPQAEGKSAPVSKGAVLEADKPAEDLRGVTVFRIPVLLYLQTPRACARVVQPYSLHTALLPPPCLLHRPLALTALVQLLTEQIFLVPCLLHNPRAFPILLQPSAEHATVLLSCFLHFPLVVMALEMHASVVQYP